MRTRKITFCFKFTLAKIIRTNMTIWLSIFWNKIFILTVHDVNTTLWSLHNHKSHRNILIAPLVYIHFFVQ